MNLVCTFLLLPQTGSLSCRYCFSSSNCAAVVPVFFPRRCRSTWAWRRGAARRTAPTGGGASPSSRWASRTAWRWPWTTGVTAAAAAKRRATAASAAPQVAGRPATTPCLHRREGQRATSQCWKKDSAFRYCFCLGAGVLQTDVVLSSTGSNGHGKPGKVLEFLNGYFQSWKKKSCTIFEKSWNIHFRLSFNSLICF